MATSSQGNHKEHALHNENVYEFLKQEDGFIDWRVTTAFYSSLHFVEHKLFPLTSTFAGKKETFHSIEEYRTFYSRRSKHEARVHAVKNHLKVCRAQYKQLFDLSMLARYKQYKFSEANKVDKHIEQCLQKIKQVCIN